MDRYSEREKSGRKHRDSDRDRDRDSTKHRSSKDKSRDVAAAAAADDDYHHRSKHRDSSVDERHRSRGDRERSEDFHDRDRREKSYERSEDLHERDRREKSYEREGSRDRDLVSSRRSSKRKERGESEDRNDDNGDKRVRVSDERKERRRFGDKAEDEGRKENNGRDREVRREKRKFEDDGVKEEKELDKRETEGGYPKVMVKKDPKEEPVDIHGLGSNMSGSTANDTGVEPLNKSRNPHESSLAPSHSASTKVSSITPTNENKGVNSNRSHEVPGKSSTDGTASAAGKSGGLSLDALAKAKRTLQLQKELLKKIPLLNKASASSKDDGQHISSKLSEKTVAVNSPVGASASALPAGGAASVKTLGTGLPQLAGLTQPKFEAVKRAQELAAKMGFRQDPEFAPLINMFPGQLPPEVTVQPKPAKAPVLRLDALGREVDEHGNVVNIPKLNNLSTLKVNINKQKKDAFQILQPELEVDPDKNPHFDPRMGIDKTKLLRPKRMTFQFVEEGKWSKDAEIMKLKSQFGEAQAKELKVKQAQLAKAKAEPDINPNLIEVAERVKTKVKPKEPIPEIEWWDVLILQSGTYDDITEEGDVTEKKLNMVKVNNLVEHPLPIEPPAEPAPPPPQPLKLTQKERKKLRTQRRLATEKNRQEMIRQGLIEPPKPKVKMSNLMKVLGSEATQDPTRLEMEIRSAAEEREKAHADRNIARKLTPAEKREKKERKLFDDPNTLETIVSVYKVNDLSHPQTRFKVDVNAQENRLTGSAVISDGICVVVVEGGSKSIKRYQKLMLKRINWAAAVKEEDEDMDENEEKPVNKCLLVWQGSVAKASFNRFSVHECRTEAAARKVFADAGVGHYWDLSVNFNEDQA